MVVVSVVVVVIIVDVVFVFVVVLNADVVVQATKMVDLRLLVMEDEFGWVENSRVKIVLGCCYICQVRLYTKFQTTRTFISSRSRVPGWVGLVVGGEQQ